MAYVDATGTPVNQVVTAALVLYRAHMSGPATNREDDSR
jgi:hypothetical protein